MQLNVSPKKRSLFDSGERLLGYNVTELSAQRIHDPDRSSFVGMAGAIKGEQPSCMQSSVSLEFITPAVYQYEVVHQSGTRNMNAVEQQQPKIWR